MTQYNELENLLHNRYEKNRVTNLYPAGDVRASVIPLSTAAKNATVEDFISMVAKLSNKALKSLNVEFYPDEGATIADPEKKLEKTAILYRVIERKPKNELKMRHSEDIEEVVDGKNNKKRLGQIWSQRHDCIIQFDIVASDYATANKVMNSFEDMIFQYSGYFKENGIAEIYFKKYFTDTSIDRYRQYLSVRSIQYFVEIEKQTTIFNSTLEEIIV